MKHILLGTALISLLAVGVEAQSLVATSYTAVVEGKTANNPSAINISKNKWVSGSAVDMMPIPLARQGAVIWTSSTVATSGSVLLTDEKGNVLSVIAASTTWGPTPVSVSTPSPAFGYGVKVSPTTWTSQSIIYNSVIQYPVWTTGN